MPMCYIHGHILLDSLHGEVLSDLQGGMHPQDKSLTLGGETEVHSTVIVQVLS